jgi:hypothetical protein
VQLRERFDLVIDESGHWTVLVEPPPEDFEAAEEDAPRAGAWVVAVRILRLVAVLIVIVALLTYFAVPFNNIFSSVPYRLRHPDSGTRTIPLAPEPPASPKIPA